MGRKGSSSWLTAVKRAFMSPSKDSERKTSGQGEEEEKVRVLCFLPRLLSVFLMGHLHLSFLS